MDDRAARQRLCRLLEPHHQELRGFARRLCRGAADGDDLFQEAALRALLKLDGLREDGAFRVWFYRVLLSVHRNRYRQSFWRRLVPIGDEHETEAAWPVEPGSAERLRAALGRLPAPQREAIVLFELQGMTVTEIAELQGVSPSAIKSRLARSRRKLRAIYRKRFAIGDDAIAALVSES